MTTWNIATAPGTWGVEPGGDPRDFSWTQVLDEIAAAGFDGTELGPLGYYPEDPDRLGQELAARGLTLAGGFLMEPLHRREERERICALARRVCRVLSGANATALVVIEGLVPERSCTAGRTEDAKRLEPTAWEELLEAVVELAGIASGEFGLRVAFHPHAGTYVEFADEIDRLMRDLAGAPVGLCLDTGHAAYAGIEPVVLCERYGKRIEHVHLKDVRPDVFADARGRKLSFEEAVAAGVFCPLGQGEVALDAVGPALERIGYDGRLVFEQDRLAGDTAALGDAEASLEYLRAVGLARGRQSAPAG